MLVGSRPTIEQVQVLAALEQVHGSVHLLEDLGAGLVEQILAQSLTDTRVYACKHCLGVFSIEPDGEIWSWDVLLHPAEGEDL